MSRRRRHKRREVALPPPPVEAPKPEESSPSAVVAEPILGTPVPDLPPPTPWRGQIALADGKRLDVDLQNALLLADEAEAATRFKLDEPAPVAIETEARKAGFDGIIYRSPALVVVLDPERATPVPEEPSTDWMSMLLAGVR